MIVITDNEFEDLTQYVYANYGIRLNAEKRSLVTSRLHSVLEKENLTTFTDYLKVVKNDRSGQAAATFIEKITTNHTYFMRETEHFDYLRDHVFPTLFNSRLNPDHDIRIWSAGCSTGEEPYTLAMLMDDYLGQNKSHWDSKILATDISNQCLKVGEAGVYPEEKVQTLPPQWRLAYFRHHKKEHTYQLIDRLLQEVLFRRLNLMAETFPFKTKFHIIFCRNVMIYFDTPTRNRLIQKFYNCLEPGGYLFIGHSETINREHIPFDYIKPAVYRKKLLL